VANRLVKKVTMSNMRDLVGNIAQSNHYMVSFSALNTAITRHLSGYIGIDNVVEFLSRKSGLLCSEASLPTSSFATGEVKDNFMGIPQEFAHTRIYTDIDFTFYVDNDYTNLMIFEGWMDYISSAGEIGELNENYYRRLRYPDEYKVQSMFISKFEKNYSSQIDYQFINAFPKTMTAIPVSYGEADLLKVSVSFNYDRYIMNPKGYFKKSNASFFKDMSRSKPQIQQEAGIDIISPEKNPDLFEPDYVPSNKEWTTDDGNETKDHRSGRDSKGSYTINSRGRKVYN